MIDQPTIPSRLADAKRSLEAISTGQRYNFTSLLSKRSENPGTYDYSALISTVETYYRITVTPASGVILPVSIDVRYRQNNPNVLAAPDYNTTTIYLNYNRQPPTASGVHVLDVRYATNTIATVYFKVVVTGMDDYTISMVQFTP